MAEPTREDLEAAIADHVADLKDVPLSPMDVTVRFIIYARMLLQVYGMSEEELAALLPIASAATMGYTIVDNSTAN